MDKIERRLDRLAKKGRSKGEQAAQDVSRLPAMQLPGLPGLSVLTSQHREAL